MYPFKSTKSPDAIASQYHSQQQHGVLLPCFLDSQGVPHVPMSLHWLPWDAYSVLVCDLVIKLNATVGQCVRQMEKESSLGFKTFNQV